jgi:hypothetical protein
MNKKDESEVLALSKQHINRVLFVGCFAVAIMAIFGAMFLYSGTVKGQESDSIGVGSNQSGTNASSANANSSQVDFDSNIEQIRGHLQQAVANKELGNTTLAKAHTLHPIDEIYSSIAAEIAAKDLGLNQSLSSSLDQLSNMVDNSTAEVFVTKASDIEGLLNETVAKVIPVQETESSGFNLMVVGNLLSTAENE